MPDMTDASERNGGSPPAAPEALYGRCGAFCGSCCRLHGRTASAAARLLAIVEGSGLGKSLTEERFASYPPTVGEHYRTAKHHLEVLRATLSCWGCQNGGGPRDCEIRSCCEQKGYKICFECPEFSAQRPCGKMQEGWLEACNVQPTDLAASKAHYDALGLAGWLAREAGRIDLGWRSGRAAMRRHVDTVKEELAQAEARVRQAVEREPSGGGSNG